QVRLKAAGHAVLEVEHRIEFEEIEPRFEQRALFFGKTDDADVAVQFSQRNRLGGAGDNDTLSLWRRRLLSVHRAQANAGQANAKNDLTFHRIFHRTIQ